MNKAEIRKFREVLRKFEREVFKVAEERIKSKVDIWFETKTELIDEKLDTLLTEEKINIFLMRKLSSYQDYNLHASIAAIESKLNEMNQNIW